MDVLQKTNTTFVHSKENRLNLAAKYCRFVTFVSSNLATKYCRFVTFVSSNHINANERSLQNDNQDDNRHDSNVEVI